MIGVILLIGPDALQGLGNNVLGQLAVLGATLSYGFAGVYGKRFKNQPVPLTTATMLIAATALILPISLWLAPPWSIQLNVTAVASVITLAIFNTALAFIVWLTIVLRAGANNSSQVTFIIPIVAIVLGFVVLGEKPGWNVLAGLLFILSGLMVAQGRFKQMALPKYVKGL